MKTRVHMASRLLGAIGWILLSSCTALSGQGTAGTHDETKVESIQGAASARSPFDRRVHLIVPFFPDETDQCGPATLASLLTYWGISSDPRTLKEEIYLRRIRGTFSIDLLLAAQSRGLQVEGFGGTLEQLKAEVAAGHPVVALLNLGWAIFPQGHYVVVTGYDEQRQGLYVHSGLVRDVFVPYAEFLDNWDKTGRWMLRAQPRTHQIGSHERIGEREWEDTF